MEKGARGQFASGQGLGGGQGIMEQKIILI